MTFTGDAGTVMMWLWEGFSDDLVAVLAAITLVWDISNVAVWGHYQSRATLLVSRNLKCNPEGIVAQF